MGGVESIKLRVIVRVGANGFFVAVGRLIVIPVSFLRRLDSLKYTSLIALVSIGYLVIIVVGHFLRGDTREMRGEILVFRWAGAVQALSSFPVMVFAYTCHQNVRFRPCGGGRGGARGEGKTIPRVSPIWGCWVGVLEMR